MAAPQPKPKYILKGPRVESVKSKLYTRDDEDGLSYKEVTEDIPCYMLFIPHGPKGEYNSVRISAKKWETIVKDDEFGVGLNEFGVRPDQTPLIDEETGETVGSFAHRAAQDYGPDPVLSKPKAKAAE